MKPAVLFLTVLGCVAATPSGYYHQEYNYKTSASSYKNNELQHQTDDQGYYRKAGDLEGKVRPKVDANSEHSEYINPNLRTGEYNTGLIGGANGDMSSYGHMRADIGSYGAHDLSSEGMAHADHIAGSRRAAAYSGSYGASSYDNSQSYGTSSNLRSVTSNIQQQLERDLQNAIQENRAYSQSSVGVAELERELRQNLTERLNTELAHKYGQQSVRGGLSYTISGGRLHSTANYDNQELQDLRRQLENSLLNQLRSQYYQSSSRYESQQASRDSYGYSTTTVRPVYYTHYPVAHVPLTTIRPSYSVDYTRDNYIRHTPIPNPESITTIASRVQNQLDARLNELLEDAQRRYFSSSSAYSLTNADVVLENLRNELRNNITYLLNENVRVNYGNQIPRDGYMYTDGPNGQISSQYNYAIKDLENLRSQIERNLIEKLNRDFERYRSRWNQQTAYSQASHSSGNIRYSDANTPRYDVYSSPRYDIYSTPQYKSYDSDVEHFSTRPSSSHIAPLISSGGSSSSNRHYNLLAGSSQSGYEISGSGGSSSISQLQRQLQQDMSRQLQAAISRGHYGSSYSSSGSYNPQSYQLSLQQLSDELNRNLTRQLQEYSASGSYSSYGNFDQAQLASLRSQLQSDLMRQLQQGLQQSYHSSSSYSASSSSSSSNANYRPVRGFDNYQSGQYRSGGNVLTMDGADCVGDDPTAYNTHRMKRSYQPYRSQPLGLGYRSTYNAPNYGYSGNYRNVDPSYGSPSYGTNQPQRQREPVEAELGQQVDDSDLTQQVDDSDLTQQVEDVSFEKLQTGSLGQQQVNLGQQVDDSDLTQQVEDSGIDTLHLDSQRQQDDLGQQQVEPGFGELQLGSQNKQQIDQGQQVDNSDLTQQVEESGLGQLQLDLHGQHQIQLGQEVDNSDLTQQVEDLNFGGSQVHPQVDNTDLTQQVDDSRFGKIESSSQNQPQTQRGAAQQSNLDQRDLNSQQRIKLGQQEDNSDLSQQIEDSRQDRVHLGQQEDTSDLTQQVEDSFAGGIQSESLQYPHPQNVQRGDQQSEDLGSSTSQGQQRTNSDQQQVSGSGSTYTYNNSELKFNQKQTEVAQQLETELSKQLRDAVRTSYTLSYSGSYNYQSVYQNLIRELERNLTKQLQTLGPSSSGSRYSYVFNGQQLDTLQKHLKNDLKLQLQREISNTASSINVGQQQIDQESNFELNSAQNNNFNNQRTTNSNSGFVQRPNNFENLELEGQTQNREESFPDLTQQVENSRINQQPRDFGQGWLPDVTHFHDNNPGGLQLGTQQIGQQQVGQQQVDNQNDLTQQIDNNPFSNPQLTEQQQTVEVPVPTGQFQQVNPQLTPGQVISNQPDDYYSSRPYLSGNLQFGNRPINRKPIDSGNFLRTEINQQHLYPTQDTTRQQHNFDYKPNSLPTLNQVIQQHNAPDVEVNASSESESATAENDLSQKVETAFTDDQQQNIKFSPESPVVSTDTVTDNTLNFRPSQNNQDLNHRNSVNQGQFVTQAQSLADAQRDADLLIQTLRQSQQNRDDQSGTGFANTKTPPSYSQVLQGNYDVNGHSSENSQSYGYQSQPLKPTQQINSFNEHQDSFRVYLNDQQVQLAHQLENNLSKQLREAVSQNYYTITNYEQLKNELQRNITIQLEETFNGAGQGSYSSYSNYMYGSLTKEQREKLAQELQAEFSRLLQQELQNSIDLSNQNNRQGASNLGTTFSSSPLSYAPSPIDVNDGSISVTNVTPYSTNNLHFGHQQQLLPGTVEVASEFQPIHPQQPTVVQNVEPQVSNYDIGIKGRRRSRPRIYSPPTELQPDDTYPSVPSVASSPTLQYTVQHPESPIPESDHVVPVNPGSGTQEITELDETPQNGTQENLPWWKRFGNKVREGATNLKEKIIG